MLSRWEVLKVLWNSFKSPCLVGSNRVLPMDSNIKSVQSLTYNFNGKGYSLELTILDINEYQKGNK